MKNDLVIHIYVRNEDDLYNKFDDTKLTLSDDIISYYEDKISHAEINDLFIVEIASEKNINLDMFKVAFDYYLNDRIGDYKQKLRTNTISELFFLLIGISFLILSITLNKADILVLQILSIIGYFSIWEIANTTFLKNKNIRRSIFKLKQGLNSKIVFKKM